MSADEKLVLRKAFVASKDDKYDLDQRLPEAARFASCTQAVANAYFAQLRRIETKKRKRKAESGNSITG